MDAIREEFQKELTLLRSQGLKDSVLRRAYEEKVAALRELAVQLRKQGCEERTIAKRLHSIRRTLGEEYKEAAPPLFREYIYYATEKQYGDPLGPTFEQLKKWKTDLEIIESASRPIPDLDNRLTISGFVEWFEAVYGK